MSVQPFLIGQDWMEVKDGDPSVITLHRRHYSYEPPPVGKRKQALCVGPGFKLVLLSADGGALCAWRKEKHRADGQEGVNCTIFRREAGEVASIMLGKARRLAWQRWPGERLFTFVDPAAVPPAMVKGPRGFLYPVYGYCFYQDGWRFAGLTKKRLHILEMRPEWAAEREAA